MYDKLFSWTCTVILCMSLFFGNYFCGNVNAKPKEWSYFVFAQQWPPAACLNVPHGKTVCIERKCCNHEPNQYGHLRYCLIPQGVGDWTVHGLWPTSDKGYPSFCNSSWPFNPKSIQSILQPLEVKWPNIYADSTENSFWKHEWLKHGTCATSLPRFNSELNYFKRSLELHDKYNIYEFLRRDGIYPTDEHPIVLQYIRNLINLNLNKTTKLFCKNHKKYDFPILTSMYVCLDKSEQVIDCDEITEPECDKAHVLYLPFY